MTNFKVKECSDTEVVKVLFKEYSQIKGAESCFVSFDKELADLEGFYRGGALLVGYEENVPVACIAIKKLSDATCEAKRLFIKPESRGKGYARIMLNTMLDKAKELGFEEVTFTTKPAVMQIGYGLYKRMGFEEYGEENGTVSMRMAFKRATTFIEHIAMYVNDLEAAREFFVTFLGGTSNDGYHNEKTDFKSYFISFGGGARLEIMNKPVMADVEKDLNRTGYAHIAFSVGSKEAVDELTAKLKNAGYEVVSGPRTTGDGYYESCIVVIEGNQIEITV